MQLSTLNADRSSSSVRSLAQCVDVSSCSVLLRFFLCFSSRVVLRLCLSSRGDCSVATNFGAYFLPPRVRDGPSSNHLADRCLKIQRSTSSLFLACARDCPCSEWGTDTGMRSRSAHGMPFPSTSRVVRLVENEAFIRLFKDSSFNLTDALLALRRTQEDDWFVSCYVGWLQHSLAEGAVELVERFTKLPQKRGTHRALLRP